MEEKEVPVKTRAKRKRINGDRPEECFTEHSAVRCPLKLILQYKPLLASIVELVHVVSKTRVLISLVWKYHVLYLLQHHIPLPEMDQTYLCRIATLLKGGKCKNEVDEPLQQCVNQIKHQFPDLTTSLCAKAVTQALMSDSRVMLANWKTFNTYHADTSLACWLTNQLRWLTEDPKERPAWRKYIKAKPHIVQDEITPELTLLRSRYLQHQATIANLFHEGVVQDHNALLQVFWQLKSETEALPLPADQKKTVAILPENHIRAARVKIDSIVLRSLCSGFFQPTSKDTSQKKKRQRKRKLKTAHEPPVEPEEVLKAPRWPTGTTPPQELWHRMFDVPTMQAQRKSYRLAWYIHTNGVSASIAYERDTLKQYGKKKAGMPAQVGEHVHKNVSWKVSAQTTQSLVAIDPGKCTLLATHRLSDGQMHDITQRRYKHESGLTAFTALRRAKETRFLGPEFHTALSALPGAKTSGGFQRLDEYIGVLATFWVVRWRLALQRSFLKREWRKDQKRQRFMDHVVNEVAGKLSVPKEQRPILLFGQGGQHHGFSKVRGGGLCGPVVELRKKLAKRTAVMMCSEFRTTKCCMVCGGTMGHPTFAPRGVSFCLNACTGEPRRLLGRDQAAALCIGARVLAVEYGQELGVFDTSVKWKDRAQAARPELLAALQRYRSHLAAATA